MKTAIITGASRGIGKATAELFSNNGYAVCIVYKSNSDKANSIADKINKNGGKAITIQADITKEEEIIKLFENFDNQLGSLSVLVNNAGITGGLSKVENVISHTLNETFNTNITASFLCSKEAVKRMKGAGGAIINISSQAAIFGGNELSHYAASKAAINAFTTGFAREVAEYGIRVNAVSPGLVDTDQQKDIPEERKKRLIESAPMKRMASPEEIAEVILWLASDKASYVSGAIIPVSGAR